MGSHSLIGGNHTRGSSGSNGLKQFEDNLESGLALLSQTLELSNHEPASNSRTFA
jgi:hypothetical protein